MNKGNTTPIFFIICKGRSGSTLLANLLDSNPNVLVPFENTFLMHLYPKYKKIKLWDKETIDAFLDDLFILNKTKKNWSVNKETLRNKLYSQLDKKTNYGSVCETTYLSFTSIFPKENILLIGDKNPFYTFCVDEIKEIYPDAKFIHLIRDARANIRSHIISFNTNFLSFIAFKWLYYINEVEEKKKLYPNSFITIRYEDLVSSPESTLKDICVFLNINYNPNSLEFHKTVNEKLAKFKKYSEGIHANLIKPIDAKINDKWKTYFDKKQINTINFICQNNLKKYHYHFENIQIKSINKLEVFTGRIYYKLWLFVVKTFYKTPFLFKKNAFKLMNTFSKK